MFDDDAGVITAIARIAGAHPTPEDIDDGPMTAPSKRLLDVFAAYQKPLHGPLAVSAIGIDRIRAVCPHFHRWLEHVEALAASISCRDALIGNHFQDGSSCPRGPRWIARHADDAIIAVGYRVNSYQATQFRL